MDGTDGLMAYIPDCAIAESLQNLLVFSHKLCRTTELTLEQCGDSSKHSLRAGPLYPLVPYSTVFLTVRKWGLSEMTMMQTSLMLSGSCKALGVITRVG